MKDFCFATCIGNAIKHLVKWYIFRFLYICISKSYITFNMCLVLYVRIKASIMLCGYIALYACRLDP